MSHWNRAPCVRVPSFKPGLRVWCSAHGIRGPAHAGQSAISRQKPGLIIVSRSTQISWRKIVERSCRTFFRAYGEPNQFPPHNIHEHGEVREWPIRTVSKTVVLKRDRGFKSHPLRHNIVSPLIKSGARNFLNAV